MNENFPHNPCQNRYQFIMSHFKLDSPQLKSTLISSKKIVLYGLSHNSPNDVRPYGIKKYYENAKIHWGRTQCRVLLLEIKFWQYR